MNDNEYESLRQKLIRAHMITGDGNEINGGCWVSDSQCPHGAQGTFESRPRDFCRLGACQKFDDHVKEFRRMIIKAR